MFSFVYSRRRFSFLLLNFSKPEAKDDRDDPDPESIDVWGRAFRCHPSRGGALWRLSAGQWWSVRGRPPFKVGHGRPSPMLTVDPHSNVQGGYAQRLTGGDYETDVSRKYVEPQLAEGVMVEGSRGLFRSRFPAIWALLPRWAFLGLVLMLGVYLAALLRSFEIGQARREIANVAGDSSPLLRLQRRSASSRCCRWGSSRTGWKSRGSLFWCGRCLRWYSKKLTIGRSGDHDAEASGCRRVRCHLRFTGSPFPHSLCWRILTSVSASTFRISTRRMLARSQTLADGTGQMSSWD